MIEVFSATSIGQVQCWWLGAVAARENPAHRLPIRC